MVMWFHMTTISMQPWRIYPLCLIVYKSEPHNHFITSTTVLIDICYVFCYNRQCCPLYFLLLFFYIFMTDKIGIDVMVFGLKYKLIVSDIVF
ncbi:hypothetical protein HanPSC8_Chr13g0586921 [Helianthus annuus]|nr:hypothetical protein HanPSC8_Chr13g0586921 [Helianthus annuus]